MFSKQESQRSVGGKRGWTSRTLLEARRRSYACWRLTNGTTTGTPNCTTPRSTCPNASHLAIISFEKSIILPSYNFSLNFSLRLQLLYSKLGVGNLLERAGQMALHCLVGGPWYQIDYNKLSLSQSAPFRRQPFFWRFQEKTRKLMLYFFKARLLILLPE